MSKKNFDIELCKICGKEFVKNVYNQIYCSSKCYNIAMNNNRRQETKFNICPICGKEFKLKVHNQIYCSEECKNINYNKNKETKHKKYKICPVCKTKFELTTHNKKYCSIECRKKDKINIIYKICEYCGKKFIPNNGMQKYCCKRCAKDAVNTRYRVGYKPKKCKKCGNVFTPTSSRANYCDDCKNIALKENKKIKAREYVKFKRNNDLNYKIKCWCRNQIYRCLDFNLNTSKKDKHTFDILGYTPNQLKQRLEFQFKNGMTWENQGTYWEIHHKKELSRFNFILSDGSPNYSEIKIANSLANLQPITKEEHKLLTIQFNKNK